ncbi:TPA: hypothetical protein ACPTVF_004460 [Escherichia coli]
MYNEVKRYKWHHGIQMLLWYPYIFIALPMTLLYCWTIISLDFRVYLFDHSFSKQAGYNLAWLLLILSFIPLYFHFKRINQRLKTQKKIIEYIMKETGFTLTGGYFRIRRYLSIWVGIDNINGNILFVQVFPSGIVDVLGFSAGNITQWELDNTQRFFQPITLHTNLHNYPFVRWPDPTKADLFYDLITRFMATHRGDNGFQERVFALREKLQEIAGVTIPSGDYYKGGAYNADSRTSAPARPMTHALAQAHANAQKLKAWQAEMQRKEDEERARERQQQNANHSAPAMDEPEYVELPRIPELSPEEQAALDKSTEKERAEMEKILGPIPTSFN